MGIPAGQLDHRITIKNAAYAADSEGQMVAGTPVDVASVWAKKQAASGGEAARGVRVEASATWLFTVRHRTDVTHEHYIEDSNAVKYEIVRVYDPDAKGVVLRIEAKEMTS
jgi:SPP1 family predicted phage head-tail adaptor